jgi:hypothetical protein
MLNVLTTLALLCSSMAWAQSDDPSSREEVTTEDVKTFLDPTVMINSLDYSFQADFLPSSIKAYTNKFGPFYAVNRWTGFWADIPIQHFTAPDGEGRSGVGDIQLGWGAVTHENLERRFTTSVVSFEALAPSGDTDKLTGFGTWILAPGGALAFNPTDVFPIYVAGRFLYSLESLGGKKRDQEVAEQPDLRVRSLERIIQTVHILPKGFFVSAIPSFLFNLNQDFNVFSLGVGAGRALSKKFLISGGYVHRVAGQETFKQAFTVQLGFVFGERKDE